LVRRTKEEIEKSLLKVAGKDYLILSDYIGRHEKILCKHILCGYTWWVEAGAFLGNKNKKGSRCPNCCGNIKKTPKEFENEVRSLSNGEFEVLTPYKNAKTKVLVRHLICGVSRMVNPNSFTSFSKAISCPYCNGGTLLSKDMVQKRISELTEGEYSLLGSYIDCHHKICIKHNPCGTILETTLASMATHKSAPVCTVCYSKYKGEALVAQVLCKYDITYVAQKRFNSMKFNGKSTLSYDFYIPSNNVAIEYQGEQHYKPLDFFGGYHVFSNQVKRDNTKKDFANDNGISLVLIPYTVKTVSKVEKILQPYILAKK